MVKKISVLFLTLLIGIGVFNFSAVAANNLCANGSFEEVGETLPVGWTSNAWNAEGDASFTIEKEGAHSGSNFITIQCSKEDDAKLLQEINVKPSTVYKFSCYIKAQGITNVNNVGANISVTNITNYSKSLYDTAGSWEYVEFYGKTDNNQNKIEVAARIGGYANVNSGKASFDDFTVEEVTDVPNDVTIMSLSSGENKSGDQTDTDNNNTDNVKVDANILNSIINYIAVGILILLSLFIILNKKMQDKVEGYKNKRLISIIMLGVALIVRILMIFIGALNTNINLLVTSILYIAYIFNEVKIIIEYIKRPPSDSNSNTAAEETKGSEEENTDIKNVTLDNEDDDKKKIRLVKIDYILLGILIAVYSVIAFINLGSLNVPKSYWKPTKVTENVTVDLGETKDINSVGYYFGLGEGSYLLSFSNDAVNWENPTTIEQKDIYNWKNTSLGKQARYVKITVQKSGGMMNEMAFLDDKNNPYPIKEILYDPNAISASDIGIPKNVFDEQNYVQKNSSYLTGMYFDEIYHARTAFEQLNGITAYESTHPPLGKIFIQAGVAVFGMDPFGWRVAGTLFGILLIPLMYLFGKRLFKKSQYAFLAAFLMTFDFMHFTQSRIATIDIYAVFFIVAMYYFMYRFIQTNIYKDGIIKSLIYITLCGLSFALGVASKWICLYSAVGLAIIFFIEIYDRYIEYKYAQKYVLLGAKQRTEEKTNYYKFVIKKFGNYNLKVFGWCVVSFIVIPIIVYILSYIPYLMVPNANHTLSDVLKAQSDMLSYHSGLDATHPYSSSWWQWPFVDKPLYYYTGQAASGNVSKIILLGNFAVWWVGLVSAFATIVIGIIKKDKLAFFIVIGGLSQYLPWLFVSRLTFLYHYFATLPFIMLCTVYIWAFFNDKYPKLKYAVYGFMGIVLLLFIMFYPIMSGMEVSKEYVKNFLVWFESWGFFA